MSTEAECSRCFYQLLHTCAVVPVAVVKQKAELSTSVCVTWTAGLKLCLLQERKRSSHPAAGALPPPHYTHPSPHPQLEQQEPGEQLTAVEPFFTAS